MVGKLCGIYFPLPHSSPWLSDHLEDGDPHSQCRTLDPASRGSRAEHILKEFHFFLKGSLRILL